MLQFAGKHNFQCKLRYLEAPKQSLNSWTPPPFIKGGGGGGGGLKKNGGAQTGKNYIKTRTNVPCNSYCYEYWKLCFFVFTIYKNYSCCFLKVVFLLVCFLSLNKSTCQTRKNIFEASYLY